MAQSATFRDFLRAFWGRWFTAMSGPLSVPFAALAVYVDSKWLKILFGLLAVICAVFASYWVWRRAQLRALELEEACRPKIEIVHVQDCQRCHGPHFPGDGSPLFQLEISNASANQSIRSINMAIEAISPQPTMTRGVLEYPINLADWEALNPSQPPLHCKLFSWDLHNNAFVFGPRPISCRAGEYTISVVAHATDTPARKATFIIKGDGLMWRLHQSGTGAD